MTGEGTCRRSRRRDEPSDWPSAVGEQHLPAPAHLLDERGEVLACLADARRSHASIVLHVAYGVKIAAPPAFWLGRAESGLAGTDQ